MFHPMKQETADRRRREHVERRQSQTIELRRRLAEKAANDPEGESGIWAEMLREHE